MFALVCSYQLFLKNLKRDLILHASGVIITHPFQVISIRMMAQFVGRESIYRWGDNWQLSHWLFDELLIEWNYQLNGHFISDIFYELQLNLVIDQGDFRSRRIARIFLRINTEISLWFDMHCVNQYNMLSCQQILYQWTRESHLFCWIHSICLCKLLVSNSSGINLHGCDWFKVH